METRRITYLGLFTAAALVLHVVESTLPPLLAFAPGAKMGLGNVVSLVAVFILGVADAYFILTVPFGRDFRRRNLVACLLTARGSGFAYR